MHFQSNSLWHPLPGSAEMVKPRDSMPQMAEMKQTRMAEAVERLVKDRAEYRKELEGFEKRLREVGDDEYKARLLRSQIEETVLVIRVVEKRIEEYSGGAGEK